METPATYDDVTLILKLYELRRDDKLREARDWFRKFQANTMPELEALAPQGSQNNAYFRMVTSYWEMVASFVTSGVLNQELFLQSGGELLFVWEKIRDLVPGLRKAFQNQRYLHNMERVANAAIETMNRENPKAYEAFSNRVRGLR